MFICGGNILGNAFFLSYQIFIVLLTGWDVDCVWKIFLTQICCICVNVYVQECFWVLGCVGKRHGKSVQILTESLNLTYWIERGILSFLLLSKFYGGGGEVLDLSWRRQRVSERSDPPCNFLPRRNLSLLWKSGCFVPGTIHVKLGPWGDCCTRENSLVFCSGISIYCLYWMLGIYSGTSTVCVPVLLACVVNRPRATLWNNTKPLDHQPVLQEWIWFQISLLSVKYWDIWTGRMALAELSHYSKIWALHQISDLSDLRTQVTRDILGICGHPNFFLLV